MVVMRKNKRRHGPLQLPSCGPPLLVRAFVDLVAHTCPVSALLDDGIPISTYENFVGTEVGVKLAREKAATLILREGATMYVPAAHILHLCYYKPLEKKSKGVDTDYGFATITPLPLESQLQASDVSAKAALLKWNKSAAKDKRQVMWEQRLSFLAKILE